MRFWDASAVVPLVVDEPATKRLRALATGDPAVLVWWASQVECASAIARREREGTLDGDAVDAALTRLAGLTQTWQEIDPSDALRSTALRLVRGYSLRAADALQLAAAVEASGRQPSSLEIVTLDDRLASAARREGFTVVSAAPAS